MVSDCPVIDFWQPSIKGTNGINKIGPVTLVLDKLNYALLFEACVKYMGLYGTFPILVTYDMEEEDWDDKAKEYINNPGLDQFSPISSTNPVTDPRTAKRKEMGPGTVIEVPVPGTKNEHDVMTKAMDFISMKVENLDYADKKLKEIICEIKEICTGEDSEYLNEIAKNAEMLSASYDSKETIIIWTKRQIERVHRFVTKTKAELRYGKGYLTDCTIDYGSDYFLKDASSLSKEYAEAVKNGMPQAYSIQIAKAASDTRFKNNPENLAKSKILIDLEPYVGMTWEVIKSLDINKRDKINFIIKANFVSFVSRFENENGSIVNFGAAIDYRKKIETIKKEFERYAKEINWEEEAKPKQINNEQQD